MKNLPFICRHSEEELDLLLTLRRMEAESAAACMEESVAMFPFGQPHLHEAKRQERLEGVRTDESRTFVKLSRKICGDQAAFLKLAEYLGVSRDDFKSA